MDPSYGPITCTPPAGHPLPPRLRRGAFVTAGQGGGRGIRTHERVTPAGRQPRRRVDGGRRSSPAPRPPDPRPARPARLPRRRRKLRADHPDRWLGQHRSLPPAGRLADQPRQLPADGRELSGRNSCRPTFASTVATIDSAAMDPARFTLERTETVSHSGFADLETLRTDLGDCDPLLGHTSTSPSSLSAWPTPLEPRGLELGRHWLCGPLWP